MSTVGLWGRGGGGGGVVIEVVSSRSGVRWADIICICVIDYTSLRPVEKTSAHVRFTLKNALLQR